MTEQGALTQRRSQVRVYVGRAAARAVEWSEATGSSVDAGPTLRTLRPKFIPDQHQPYVNHLARAVREEGVCNIALTGRYGAGKSSVLSEFAEQHKGRVLFLSLSTLGPETAGESRTQQIQKELVKQLLHREKPSRLPQSRYQRIDRMPRTRAFFQATSAMGTVALLLWILGALPELPGLHSDRPFWVRTAAAVSVTVAVSMLLTWIRLSVHNRLEVAGVSAAGASVTLAKKSESYFDQYLDEIVYFFESKRNIDIVVFEDLDRFDDAGIFENLRELNTLLNSSKQSTASAPWRGRRTIRFVYALRDSIFQELGHDTVKLARKDLAAAESNRANRTKFFDLVIPIVPFITHKTARELLAGLLKEKPGASLPPVRDELIDLIARHIPDMRLLINIRNEYAIFANRLITKKGGMESLTGDDVFAMVAYKNVHLADFENMLLGRSKLDHIYRDSRELITASIATRRARLRQLRNERAFRDSIEHRAESWGRRLDWLFEEMVGSTPRTSFQYYGIDEKRLEEESTTEGFWQQVIAAGKGVDAYINSPYGSKWLHLDMPELERQLGTSLNPQALRGGPEPELKAEEQRILADLAHLRSADFAQLIERPDFTLQTASEPIAQSFEVILKNHIKSELGQALISQGYINRYYTLVVAQYYGDRVPPNAMNFIIQHVDRNVPDMNYNLSSADVNAIMKETKRAFLGDVSSYNISVLDHLLEQGDQGASLVLDRLCRAPASTEMEFLEAYLTDGTQAHQAVAYISSRLPSVLVDLIDEVQLSDERRVELMDVALAHASDGVEYDSNAEVRRFVESHYADFSTLVKPRAAAGEMATYTAGRVDLLPLATQIRNAMRTIRGIGGVLQDLEPLQPAAVVAAVEFDCYAIDAHNLRVALGDPPTLSLDTIRERNPEIYEDVLNNPEAYLDAVAHDFPATGDTSEEGGVVSHAEPIVSADVPSTTDVGSPLPSRTQHTVDESAEFVAVVRSLQDLSTELQTRILAGASESCVVKDLREVPTSTWEALVESQQLTTSVENVAAYIDHTGEIDKRMAALLMQSGAITRPDESTASANEQAADGDDPVCVAVALKVINANTRIPSPRVRVELAQSIELNDFLDIDGVDPENGELLGHLLRTNMCADAESTFARFDTTDWPTLAFGIKHSKGFFRFATPALLTPDATANLLTDHAVPSATKRSVLERFDTFITQEAPAALLRAAAEAAHDLAYALSLAQIELIVDGTKDGTVAMTLLHLREEWPATEALRVVVQAGPPYDHLGTSGASESFPNDAEHRWQFKRLQEEGLVTFKAYAKGKLRAARIEVRVP